MNDNRKRRMQIAAGWIHWIAQILLAAVIIAQFAMPRPAVTEAAKTSREEAARQSLKIADGVFLYSFIAYFDSKVTGLAAFVPPEDDQQLVDWTGDVAEHMAVPAAVFLQRGGEIRWPLLPASLRPVKAEALKLLNAPLSEEDKQRVQPVGTMEIFRSSFKIGAQEYNIDIAGPHGWPVRWGVIHKFGDHWFPFIEELKRAENRSQIDWRMRILSSQFQLEPPVHDMRTETPLAAGHGLRIHRSDGGMIYETPGLDTTRVKFVQSLSDLPVWWEIYASEAEEFLSGASVEPSPRRFSWLVPALVLVMIALAILYRRLLYLVRLG